jgi:hypothetical protein
MISCAASSPLGTALRKCHGLSEISSAAGTDAKVPGTTISRSGFLG